MCETLKEPSTTFSLTNGNPVRHASCDCGRADLTHKYVALKLSQKMVGHG